MFDIKKFIIENKILREDCLKKMAPYLEKAFHGKDETGYGQWRMDRGTLVFDDAEGGYYNYVFLEEPEEGKIKVTIHYPPGPAAKKKATKVFSSKDKAAIVKFVAKAF